MIKDTASVGNAIDVLNDIANLDPIAVEQLLNVRISCNRRIANHADVVTDNGESITVLGIINAIFGFDYDKNTAAIGWYRKNGEARFVRAK